MSIDPRRIEHTFPLRRILVVGDIMLDHYIHGDAEKMSPEAPVPVIRKTSDSYNLGGAANVAHAVQALGAHAVVCGVVGDDAGRTLLYELFERAGIPQIGILQSKKKKTSIKQRIVANGHHMLRVDYEETSPLEEHEIRSIQNIIATILPGVDAVIFSDYAKGMFSHSLAQSIITSAKALGKPVIADFKPSNKDFFRGVDVIVPNVKEALAISGCSTPEEAGSKLVCEYAADVIITRGGEGMTLFLKSGERIHVPGQTVKIFDVTGAGDTVAAIIALAVSSGMSLHQAAEIANCGAGLVVQKQGTATITLEELLSLIGMRKHVEQVELVPKLWGYEKWLENSEKYCAKLLSLNKGYQCSLHYHQNKDETFLIIKGHVQIEVRGSTHSLREGNFIRIRPGTPHRFTGIEDSQILEISTYHEESDSYRLEESRMLEEHEFHRVRESLHEAAS